RTSVTQTVNGSTTTYAVLNSQGSRSNFTVTTTSINVQTSFGQTGVTECGTPPSVCTITVISGVGLPDGSSYSFGYDSGSTAGHYGLLTSMTLPTGGTAV